MSLLRALRGPTNRQRPQSIQPLNYSGQHRRGPTMGPKLSRGRASPSHLARPMLAPPSDCRQSWHYTAECAIGASGCSSTAVLPTSLLLSCTLPRLFCWRRPGGWPQKVSEPNVSRMAATFPGTILFLPLPEADRVVPFCSRRFSVYPSHPPPRSRHPSSQSSFSSRSAASSGLLHPLLTFHLG